MLVGIDRRRGVFRKSGAHSPRPYGEKGSQRSGRACASQRGIHCSPPSRPPLERHVQNKHGRLVIVKEN
jgi:hypothetical protein